MKVYYYDIGREKGMKKYVKEIVANSERVILAEMRGMEARVAPKIQLGARYIVVVSSGSRFLDWECISGRGVMVCFRENIYKY